jgi:putative sterol carrier protein
MIMSEISIQELMLNMPKVFLPDKAVGVDTVIQYHLKGAEAGDWIVTIKNGTCVVEPGTTPSPKLTLTADSQDYKDLVTGKINGMQAFTLGKLKMVGDFSIAMKLNSFFKKA